MAELAELQQVDLLLDVRRTATARERLSALLRRDPNDVEVLVRLARAEHLDDDEEQALEHVERALASDPTHEGARFLRASILCESKRYAEAEEMLLGLLRENPRDADYLAAYARVMLLALELDKAGRLAQEAIRLEPENQHALLVHGLIASVRGRDEEAQATLTTLLASDPESTQVVWLLFHMLITARRYREAERVGQQLLRLDPTDESIVDALVELRVANHWAAWPLYPLLRWGWAASAALWFVAIVGGRALVRWNPTVGMTFLGAYVILVIYSWTYQPIFKRWVRRRAS